MAANYNIPTPKKYAKVLLDNIGYKNNILDKKILENSCGEGNILVEIAERFVKRARAAGYNNQDIKCELEDKIYGVELDKERVRRCLDNLENLRLDLKLPKIKWNIIADDYLKLILPKNIDYIIGNPPYINYHDLSVETREFLKLNFASCKKGRYDYYYAFIEKSISELSDNGSFSFLIPFSFFRNKFSYDLRKMVLPFLSKVQDISDTSVFDSVEIKSVIITGKKKKSRSFYYINKNEKRYINKDSFDLGLCNFIKNPKKTFKIGDFFDISNSIATLSNKVYLVDIVKEDKNFYYTSDFFFEKDLVVSAVSNKIKVTSESVKIIFPYLKIGETYKTMDEVYFKTVYPNIYKYLFLHKKTLTDRSILKNTKWYEYGRSQGLKSIDYKKIILPKVFSENFKTYISDKGEIPIAGYYAVSKSNDKFDLLKLKEILESTDFKTYIKNNGTPVSNSSYRLSVPLILNYEFDDFK